jgi:hypothetical protein
MKRDIQEFCWSLCAFPVLLRPNNTKGQFTEKLHAFMLVTG